MAAIVDLLPDEARRRHEPTAEELARTYPPVTPRLDHDPSDTAGGATTARRPTGWSISPARGDGPTGPALAAWPPEALGRPTP